jgi:hypothetical protein
MGAEFAEQRNQNFLQECFAAAGKLQSASAGKNRIGFFGNLQPEKIKKAKNRFAVRIARRRRVRPRHP